MTPDPIRLARPEVQVVATEPAAASLLTGAEFKPHKIQGWTPDFIPYVLQEAIDVAAARTGRAFIVSALTAISGVAVIATSSLPLLRDFGIIVAVNVAVALLSALVVLPPMLVWADNHGWVTRLD